MPQDLKQHLEDIINDTEPGGRLPSEPKLAETLGVSRATLREAMRTFETQGRLRRRQGVGTFVVFPSQIIESGLEVLESIEVMAERIGLEVSMGDLVVDTQIATEKIADVLQLDPGSEVLRVSRVILAEAHPVAYLEDILPSRFLSDADVNGGFTGSVLDLLLQRGVPVLGTSRCEIAAIAASHEVAVALNIQRGDALLHFNSILYSQDGHPVDYSFSYFLPGYFRFHVVRRIGS
jgi:GntR family transcriptional regulator